MSNNSRFSRRKVLSGAGASLSLGLAGCLGNGGGGGNSGKITVGVLTPLNFQQGKDIRDGANLAVNHINSDGGVNGRDLETVVKNYKGDPATAKQMHRELILEEGADMTTGVFGGAVMLNILDSIAQQETVHFTNGAATTELEPIISGDYDKYKYHFRTVQDSAGGARNRLDFMEEQFADSTVGILYEDYKWTEPFQNIWGSSDAFDIAYEKTFSGDTSNFSPFYDEMESQGVDNCFVAMAFVGTKALTQWAREERDFTFGGNFNFMQGSDYWEQVDGLCNYGWTNIQYLPYIYYNDVTERWITDFRSQFDRLPTYTGGTAYDAIKVWAEAAKEAGTTNDDDVIPTLEEIEVDTSLGVTSFYGEGHEKVHDLIYEKPKRWDLMLQWREDGSVDLPTETDFWAGDGRQSCVYYGDNVTNEFQRPNWA